MSRAGNSLREPTSLGIFCLHMAPFSRPELSFHNKVDDPKPYITPDVKGLGFRASGWMEEILYNLLIIAYTPNDYSMV